MPVIASATPAYRSIENQLNHKVTFENIEGFHQLIDHYLLKSENRQNYVEDAKLFINKEYPEDLISKSWDNAIHH